MALTQAPVWEPADVQWLEELQRDAAVRQRRGAVRLLWALLAFVVGLFCAVRLPIGSRYLRLVLVLFVFFTLTQMIMGAIVVWANWRIGRIVRAGGAEAHAYLADIRSRAAHPKTGTGA